jgi:ATP-dependent helicase HrpB
VDEPMKIKLPVDDAIPEIQKALAHQNNLIVIAEPGAGKTTRVPPSLLSQTNKKILMLQPRRIAARAAAERIAEENGWTLGKEVGYRVRFEDCTTPQTRLIVLTEALLMRELLKDPELTEYGIIILDEFHERNLFTDAGLAALKELQDLQRPDLKILIMSASLDPIPLSKYLNSPQTISVPGRVFPVEVIYDQQAQLLNTDRNFIERVSDRVFSALISAAPSRHILVFLPGLSEIQRVSESLTKNPRWSQYRRQVFGLHGSLSLREQHHILNSQESKVILATNVAETSLTIDGVDTVIDSGLARDLQYDQRRLFPWLKTIRISKASAEQRKGRAGRQYPGRCYRMWSKLDETSLPPYSSPDIITQDLSELLLMLYQLGITDPNSFSWYESPPKQSIERAKQFLLSLGLIEKMDETLYRLNPKGLWVQQLPLSPRLASLVYDGMKLNKLSISIKLASLLNERDPWRRENLDSYQSDSQDSDLIPRLMGLEQATHRGEFQMILQSIKQITKIVKQISSTLPSIDHYVHDSQQMAANEISKLLFSSFADRIARRRRPQEKSALNVGQKGVELSSQSLVKNSEFFFCLQGHANDSNGNAIVDLAHPIPKNLLLELGANEITLFEEHKFFPEKDTWMSQEQKMFRDLPLEEPTLKPLVINSETLLALAKESFAEWKTNISSLQNWFLRLNLAKKLWPEEVWPEQNEWVLNTIEMACLGEKSLQAVKEKDWNDLFLIPLNKNQKNLLTKELPLTITTPKGRSFPLIYETSGIVNLELKIQDAFGWKETPQIAQGKIKIRMFLLGPHMRPLQTTDDLASFWKGTYQELRPSLKARYPKHSWPEDPGSF